jgi:putative phosphoribosyl transferase
MEAAPDASLTLKDRTDAGRRLAEKLAQFRSENPVVIAAHRGATPVAFEVARGLGAPLDVVVVREINDPDVHGRVLGAVAEGSIKVLDPSAVEEARVSAADLTTEVERLVREVERAGARYREGRPPVQLIGRSVILTADGIAHAVAMRAAIAAVRARGARRLVTAVGVCSRPTAQAVRHECDEIVVLRQPEFFLSVGEWYRKFPTVTEEEVIGLLRASLARPTGVGLA